MPKIILRQDAIKKNLDRYFTGRPCKRNHISERYTKSRMCIECKKEWREENKDRYTYDAYHKIYYQNHKRKILDGRSEYNKEYHKSNRDKLNTLQKKYIKEKMKDPAYFSMQRVRKRILQALKNSGIKKSSKTVDLIGCTISQLKKHLEGKFNNSMTWENRHLWEIDHIVPLNYFLKNYDFTKKNTQQIAFHHSNLQPLWIEDNKLKSDKISKSNAEKKIVEIRKQIGADKRSDV